MAMVRSTFAGFTTAQLALAASQRSIDAAGQNISNVNTEGYTRQRIDLASISPTGFSYAMMQNSILVGQGVQMTNIIQIRDPFLDVQYRNQLAKVGTIDAQDSTLTDIGAIFDEVDKTAVYAALNDVIKQLNTMANPDSSNQGSSDTLVRSAMETLLNVIHENASALDEVYQDKLTKLESTDIANINEYIKSIAALNESIKNTQILGGAALELQDQRNALVDELATYLPINVTYHDLNLGAGIVVDVMELSFTTIDENGKETRHILINDGKTGFDGRKETRTVMQQVIGADGQPVIDPNTGEPLMEPVRDPVMDPDTGQQATDDEGNLLWQQRTETVTVETTPFVYVAPSEENGWRAGLTMNCLDGARGAVTKYVVIGNEDPDDPATFVDRLGDGVLRGTYDSVNKSGSLDNPPTDFRGIGFYQKAYDSFVNTLANELNRINIEAKGEPLFTTLDDKYDYVEEDPATGEFVSNTTFTAGNIKISNEWMNGNISIKTVFDMDDEDTGNTNVLKMINAISTDTLEFQVRDKDGNVITDADGKPILAFKGNCFDAYNNLQITQAIDKKATDSILETRTNVLNDIANSKDSVSGVWMDEEVMDLMQFSHSYNAAAQLMTTLDEMLTTLLSMKR